MEELQNWKNGINKKSLGLLLLMSGLVVGFDAIKLVALEIWCAVYGYLY